MTNRESAEHPRHRLLLVDDDGELAEMLIDFLGPEGFEVEWAGDGETALRRAAAAEFDLMILDVMMPGTGGFDVLRRLRAESGLPVLMLTARGDDVDRIVGLELGADDYLAKPFNPRELGARIRAILRRAQPPGPGSTAAATLSVGPLTLDPAARRVSRDGRPISLTGTEFELLRMLMGSAGNVVTKEALSEAVLGRRLLPFDRSIDTHISNLRAKLAGPERDVNPIHNVRGVGYVLAESD